MGETAGMVDYEKLGVFYLGKEQPSDTGNATGDLLLYDSKDLTTHAVIVGMTGSGKTGLGVTILEEAAIDGIPSIIIDPKGDMGNLLLNFPNLQPGDFRPWVQPEEATRKGMTADAFAADRAELWKRGLAQWQQTPDRIQKLRDAAEMALYTPGSDAGIPLTVLKSLDAPSPAVLNSADAMRERVSGSAAGLCTLLGLDADPLRSREHILISSILDNAWRAGRNLDMAALIYEIQSPPFQKIGIMDLDMIFPAKDRMTLAMTLNNVLASPGFSGWMNGEPLNIQRLLYTPEGKPRMCILSIAHLSDQERMFFVTILLNEVISWMRSQPGTSSLRALLYMDEVFGYLPPTANPPSKTPLLTLLKQARAFGLGLVLSTQNPVDLDYKALSNAGTWFLGRLQTERDKLRVLDGLEGASATAGVQFDRSRVERILSGLGSRLFLMNNVHEDAPVVFETRWALSYLAGPMTREQIQRVTAVQKGAMSLASANSMTASPALVNTASSFAPAPPASSLLPSAGEQGGGAVTANDSRPPVLPDSIEQSYGRVSRSVSKSANILYRPAIVGIGRVHFVDSKSNVEEWRDIQRICSIDREVPRDIWTDATRFDSQPLHLERGPESNCRFSELPGDLSKSTNYTGWKTDLKNTVYRDDRLILLYCEALKRYSRPNETEGDLRISLRQEGREERDRQISQLRIKYGSKFDSLQSRIRTAEHTVQTQEEQAKGATMGAFVTFGTSILSAVFGRKLASAATINKAGTAMRSASRASQEKGDVVRAKEKLDALVDEKESLEKELEAAIDELTQVFDGDSLTLTNYEVSPRKSDITINSVGLLWQPWEVDSQGIARPAWDEPEERR